MAYGPAYDLRKVSPSRKGRSENGIVARRRRCTGSQTLVLAEGVGMTSPGLLKELTRHQAQYVRSWQVIQQLEDYATEQSTELPDFPDLERDAVETLRTPGGRSELERWMSAFKRSIALMRKFNTERESGKQFNTADWKLMAESANKALDALEKRLRRLAQAD